jgi:hypothetical protein
MALGRLIRLRVRSASLEKPGRTFLRSRTTVSQTPATQVSLSPRSSGKA